MIIVTAAIIVYLGVDDKLLDEFDFGRDKKFNSSSENNDVILPLLLDDALALPVVEYKSKQTNDYFCKQKSNNYLHVLIPKNNFPR